MHALEAFFQIQVWVVLCKYWIFDLKLSWLRHVLWLQGLWVSLRDVLAWMRYRRGASALTDGPVVAANDKESLEIPDAADAQDSVDIPDAADAAGSVLAPVVRRNRGGARRMSWEQIAEETVEAEESLRAGARRWLQEKKVLHHPLSTSSNKGHQCLLARCAECKDCSRRWCFSHKSPTELLVERVGTCTENKDRF